jgi:hypothetical protein
MILYRTIRTICLMYVARLVCREPLTRARPSSVLQTGSATRSYSKGDPIIQLTRRDRQRVTIQAGYLPKNVLGRIFGNHDVTFSPIGGTVDPYDSGLSRVAVGRVDHEMDLIALSYTGRSAQREPLFLRFPPELRHLFDVLDYDEKLELMCSFAQEPGVTEIGVFTPA